MAHQGLNKGRLGIPRNIAQLWAEVIHRVGQYDKYK